jgi:hypothetical protein
MAQWTKNLVSLIARGKAGADLANLGLVGYGAAVATKAVVGRKTSCGGSGDGGGSGGGNGSGAGGGGGASGSGPGKPAM